MRFRTRLRIAVGTIALVPLIVLAVGVRREVTRRLTADYEDQARALAVATHGRLIREETAVGYQLESLRTVLSGDNRFRTAMMPGAAGDRSYVLDYASRAMQLAGLSMLQIQDERGRIVSSGHFRNEFDRLEPDLDSLLTATPGGAALVAMRTPAGPRLALARIDSLRLGDQQFRLVGGIDVGSRFLGDLAPDSELTVSLMLPGAVTADTGTAEGPPVSSPSRGAIVAAFPFPAIGSTEGEPRTLQPAQFVVSHSLARLDRLLREVDAWFAVAIVITAAAALLVAGWLANRIARPLTVLAHQASRVDLDGPGVDLATDRDDEIGTLSRLLADMVVRLRTSAARLQETERRAIVGDLARQVSHDVKNGLIPIRHVLAHLRQVERTQPERLADVFAERGQTLEASVTYLDSLARCYGRLSPRLELRPCDVNAIVRAVAAGAAVAPHALVRLRLDPSLPPVTADPLALRRILENLVSNSIDAVAATWAGGQAGVRPRRVRSGAAGMVTITTDRSNDSDVRITVADNGCGMTDAQLNGTLVSGQVAVVGTTGRGLGLPIVRRLVADIHAAMHVQSSPASGTRVTITVRDTTSLSGVALPLPPAPAA
jgi:signal transduction histidine kinase